MCVIVITPSLNKSYKFQSDWPYNNSQVYLLSSVYDDLVGDEDRTFKSTDDGYTFTSTVNYPNNKSLVKQNVYLDKKLNITKIEVVDNDGNVQISMTYKEITFDKKFDNDYFELSNIIKNTDENNKQSNTNENNNNTNNTDTNTEDNNTTNDSATTEDNSTNTENNSSNTNTEDNNSNSETNNNTEQTATIDDIIYPMYVPNNTYLTDQQTIDTDTGQRLILTFDGDSSFTLVEETTSYNDDGLIIPVNGDIEFLTDVIGVVGENSVTWDSNGIEYYIVSDTITTAELVKIAQSLSVLPVSK